MLSLQYMTGSLAYGPHITLNLFNMVGSFCVGKHVLCKDVGGIAFIISIFTHNHHIEVNLESHYDMLCGPPTIAQESMQFIRLQIK